ncbi:Obg family GTPase CgtA [Buchnera aphidicola]|uniref:Obg family GTPase CgtA n=1 Tax=Buchnera aphidicola TaxID=9 RepID=UPI0030EBA502
MYFVDEAIINLIAGKGGNGIVSFRREKNIPRGGPDGGNGGNGGNIFIISDKNINTLSEYKFKKKIIAENGKNGSNQNKSGKHGKDTILKVPLGTKIIDLKKNFLVKEMIKNKEKIIIALGGKKGLGNSIFKSSTNRSPIKKTLGELGEEKIIKLELSLLADVGTLGLPNVGKSTLIRNISSSKTKVGNYPFTTLYPNLAAVYNKQTNKKFIIADLPGIIKGASKGIGLGIQFLKHLQRCKILLHIIDLSLEIKEIFKNIKISLNELKIFNKNFNTKNIWMVFNKIDLIAYKNFYKKKNIILKNFNKNKKIFFISSKKKINLNNLCKKIFKNLKIY